jgi:hypothetical protein
MYIKLSGIKPLLRPSDWPNDLTFIQGSYVKRLYNVFTVSVSVINIIILFT